MRQTSTIRFSVVFCGVIRRVSVQNLLVQKEAAKCEGVSAPRHQLVLMSELRQTNLLFLVVHNWEGYG